MRIQQPRLAVLQRGGIVLACVVLASFASRAGAGGPCQHRPGGTVARMEAGRSRSGTLRGPVPQAPPGPATQHSQPVSVLLSLDSVPSEEDEKLAKQVLKVLEVKQPQNPGRQKTFRTMAFKGLTPQNRESHLLKQKGWQLEIKRVEPLPDGWRATVHVYAVITRLNGVFAAAANKHIEVYRFRDGKLTLESDSVDPHPSTQEPGYEPSQGLIEISLVVGIPKPAKIPPFSVGVFLGPTATEDMKALAAEVQKELERSKPENPGRAKTFGKMEMVRKPPFGAPHVWKLKRLGWSLLVRSVERIPGGWRARVDVGARARTVEGSDQLIQNRHIEVYTFRDGKLTLESDSVDPRLDPSRGLRPGLHGWPDSAEGHPL